MKLNKPEGYKDLLVYKRAEELRYFVRQLAKKLSYSEKRRVVHLNDSARSVKQNIVEGWKRTTTKEYYEFLSFSLGSLAEIQEDIKDLREDKIISEKVFIFYTEKCREIDFLTNRLRQSLYKKMDIEGMLPLKERFNIKKELKEENNILDKLLSEAGLVKLEDGRFKSKDK